MSKSEETQLVAAVFGCNDGSTSIPFSELMQQLTDAKQRKSEVVARKEACRRPRSDLSAYSEVDPFAHRRLLHPRDFHKGILDVAAAEQIIRRGMPPKPKCDRPPTPFRTEAQTPGNFSASAPVRAQRHLGDWDLVRCKAPERTWPSKGAVCRLYDEARNGRPQWKPSSSKSREFSPLVTLERGMHGKDRWVPEKKVGRPQSAPPSRQISASAEDCTTRVETSSEQQVRPLSARSSSQRCTEEQSKASSQVAPTRPKSATTSRAPTSGFAVPR